MMHSHDAQSRPGGRAEGSRGERGQKIKIVIPGGEAGGNPFDPVGGRNGNTPSQIVFYIKGFLKEFIKGSYDSFKAIYEGIQG
jgi:hypothetical protein